jgi:xyloglucan-specific endo-beta-1,4-glucanase
MHYSTYTTLLAIIAAIAMTAYATPAPTKTHLAPRSAITTFCGEDDLAHAANYLLYNNLWGKDEATSGSQCTYLEYDEGETISWVTSWNWTGNSDEVKSYSNAVPNWDSTELSSIRSIKSSWSWKYVCWHLFSARKRY